MKIVDNIPVWGDPIDDNAVLQMKNTLKKSAVKGAIMADHHQGYCNLPVGGVAAYKGVVNPSGVGSDIACIAEGTKITTGSGSLAEIENISKKNVALTMQSPSFLVESNILGISKKIVDKILELELSNGDIIRLTEDHLVVKESDDNTLNWVESQNIFVGDKILVSPYIGVDGEVTENHIFMRLLGYLFGDGHLPKKGKNKKTNNRVCFYTSIDQDADLIKKDLEKYLKLVGHEDKVSVYRRTRFTENGIKTRENCVYSNSLFLREKFEEYGCPVGKKKFDIILLNEIFSKLSLVDKSNFISGLLGAEGGSPKLGKNNVFNPWIKMGGLNGLDFLNFIASLLNEFGFESNITRSVKRNKKQHPTYVIQIIGGMDEFENFYRTFRYYYCNNKNIELSKVISYIWNKKEIINKKTTARELCKRLRSKGEKVHFLHEKASEILGYKVNKRFALRSIYENNGRPRISEEKPEITIFNEGVFVKVINKNLIEEKTTVYDIGIDHEDHNFIANGVVVHNCGNKAVLLDIPKSEVTKNIGKIMDDIFNQISFGVGRNNEEKVEHEIFDDEIFSETFGKSLKQMAINQLGTVGAGNHYVDLFYDELDRVWCGVHFGSRGLGFKIAKHFISDLGGGRQDIFADPVLFRLDSDIGRDYWRHMSLAGEYAYAGRDWVCSKVAKILGSKILEEVHNHHNFCIPVTEKIPTPLGWKTIDKLDVGETIYGFDEETGLYETKIKKIVNSGKKKIYTIKTKNRSIRCSPEHPILTIEIEEKPHPLRKWHNKNVGRYKWKQAKEIDINDIIVCSEGYYPESEISSVGINKARLIGAFIADGWVRKDPTISGYSVGLAIGSAEENITRKYHDLLVNIFPEANWKNNASGAFGISCSNKKVWESLWKWGIHFKSKERRIPNWIFNASKEEKIAFLSGYVDGDGYVWGNDGKNNGRCRFCATSKGLVDDLRELCIGLKMCPTNIVSTEMETNYGHCIAFSFQLTAKDCYSLDLWHEKKKERQRDTDKECKGLQESKIGYLDIPENFFAQKVRGIELSDETEEVFDLEVENENHNFICEGIVVHNCWLEEHDGEEYCVVRKGCTPAFPGQKGFVGGSMGDISVILQGKDTEENKMGLCSTVHGAGRVMGRAQAKGKFKPIKDIFNNKTGEYKCVREPMIKKADMKKWIKDKNVELRGGDVDEAPQAYKRLPEVLKHHEDSVEILHTLTPIGVAMAGPDCKDPYKD